MTQYEKNCITKVYHALLGLIDRRTIATEDIVITIEILKKCADEREDWDDQQKEAYKLLADYAKEHYKDQSK